MNDNRDAGLPKIVQARFAAWRVMRGDSEGNFTGESPAEQRYMSKHWPTESGAIPALVDETRKLCDPTVPVKLCDYCQRLWSEDQECPCGYGGSWGWSEVRPSDWASWNGARDFDKEPLTPEEEAERDRWLEENNPTAEELQAAIDEADRG